MTSSRANALQVRGFVVLLALTTVFAQDAPKPRNAIVFVADGLRHASVNAADTPAFSRVRTEGVYFANSHSVFPTQTLPNAAAIATGHHPGDTGQFANQIFTGYPLFERGNFGRRRGTMVPEVEDGIVLADLNDHFGGNYLREASLLAYARAYGRNTASLGKTGPVALQDSADVAPVRGVLRDPITIIIDGTAGAPGGVRLREETIALLKSAGLATAPPSASAEQQQWFADAATKAILPAFAKSPEPFLLVFWSGEPDETQHAQGDSLNRLTPGINGQTSKSAVQNADRTLKQILDYLDRHPEVRENTNVFVTSDHGFSTVSRRDIDASGRATGSYSATLTYVDQSGRQDVQTGHLPPGFLAIDLAHHLNLPLYDPALQTTEERGGARYMRVDPTLTQSGSDIRQRPSSGAALIGGSGRVSKPTDATIVVAQTSIYVPDNDDDMVARVVRFLATQDYVGGIFVNNRFGQMPGALRMSDIHLIGSATLPKPAVAINFKSFLLDASSPHLTGVIVGGIRQHGQGDHGSLSRANTFNNMAAIGPDFKRGFVDTAPVGNADIQPTLAHVMKMKMPSLGKLRGRVITEALAGGPTPPRFASRILRSRPADDSSLSTVLMYQIVGDQVYLDEACFTRADTCR